MSKHALFAAASLIAASMVLTVPGLAEDAGTPDAEPRQSDPTTLAGKPAEADQATTTDAVAAEAEHLSPLVHDVQIVGPWSDADHQGVWRTILALSPDDSGRYRFFVQKIEDAAGGLSLLATTEVTEIAAIDGAILGYRADEPTEGQEGSLTLFFDILPSDAEISETYELHFFSDSPYEFGPASN
ncbi:hypothetical protein [Consotaella aegiceratis]|uniref:hypothetical protein n=1 Tax=Consotaella aegiceratis TaxID=3097961 RepID=UPI002F42C96B